MYKRYLLIAGHNFYPQCDTGDWIDSFVSFEQATEEVQINGKTIFEIRGKEYDWYHIEDLHNWLYRK